MDAVRNALYAVLPWLFLGSPYTLAVLIGLVLPVLVVVASMATDKLQPSIRMPMLTGVLAQGTAGSIAFPGRRRQSDRIRLSGGLP